MDRIARCLLAVLIVVLLAGCGGAAQAPTATAAASPTHTAVLPTPTATPPPIATQSPTATKSPTPTPSPQPTATPQPVLSGRVADAVTGKGIGGAIVLVNLTPSGSELTLLTAADGRYHFDSLAPGAYRVSVSASGYARKYYNNVNPSNEATLVNVSASKETSGIDFDLNAGGAISGTVYAGDGKTPISSAEVWIWPSKYPQDEGFYTRTSSDGRYRVEGLALGNYKVKAEASGYARLKYYSGGYGWDNADNVMITPPNTAEGIDIQLDLACSISGHVYQSDGKTPVFDADIVADTEGREGAWTRSRADGSYTLEGLSPTSYTMRIQAVNGFGSQFYKNKPDRTNPNQVILAAGDHAQGIDFILPPGAAIRGHIYDAVSKAPLSGAQIVAFLVNGSDVTNINTQPDGSYELWVASGCYVVGIGGHMAAPGYVPEFWEDRYEQNSATAICVRAPDPAENIDLYLVRAGSLSGRVVAKDGVTPVAGANVYAFPTQGSHPGAGANTDEDGRYTIEGLPAELYRVQVSATDFEAQFYAGVRDKAKAKLVKVSAANDTPGIDFVLNPAPR